MTDKMFSGREKLSMGGWRGKLTLMLIMYFAGFATAIYVIAPGPEGKMGPGTSASENRAAGDGRNEQEALAVNIKGKMKKYINLAEDKTEQAGKVLRKLLVMKDRFSSEE